MTIEELLDNFDSAKIASLTDAELKEYLKDIISLEPKPLPPPLVLAKDEEEEEKINPNEINCPIKPSKKRKGKLGSLANLTPAEKIKILQKELEDL